MIQFPDKTKQFLQTNRSDTLGNLAWTFNIDPQSNLGRIRVSPRMLKITDTAGDSDLTDAPAGFVYAAPGGIGKVWTVAGTKVHNNGLGSLYNTFSVDTTTNSPTTCSSDYSDIISYNNGVYVSATNDIYYNTGGTSWSTIGASLTGTLTHPMTVYANILYYSDLFSQIWSITSGNVLSSGAILTFTNSRENYVSVMRSSASRVWIGTKNLNNGKAYVYEWDGASAQASVSHRLEASACLSMIIKDDIPWIMDNNGRLMYWSGAAFVEAARLPIRNKYLKNPLSQKNDAFIHPNGMSVVNGKINLLINGSFYDSTTGTIVEACPSGVWEFDPQIGLYHKYSPSNTPISSSTITDYGQNRISRAGAISEVKIGDISASNNGQFLIGANFFTNVSSTSSGIFTDDTNDTVQKYGYFVTTKIDAPEITDTWQKIYLQYRQLLNATDRIVLKYRTTQVDPTEISIIWTSTTTFTTTDVNMANYAVGDEVEGTQGPGSGFCSHITAISNSSGTYTITVDDSFTGVVNTNTAKVRLQKWIKVPTIVNDQVSQFKELPLGPSTTWIQFKICMLFTGKDQFEYFYLVSQRAQYAK